MKPLDIQFARRARSSGWITRGAIAAALLAFGASIWHYAATRDEFARVDADIQAVASPAAQRRAASAGHRAPAIPEDRILAINGAIGQMNLPWAQLFAVFEANKPASIALLSFEPDGKRRTLFVEAESRVVEDMLAFVDRLRRVPFFEEAYLTRHELREQDPNRPYRFSLELRWREGG